MPSHLKGALQHFFDCLLEHWSVCNIEYWNEHKNNYQNWCMRTEVLINPWSSKHKQTAKKKKKEPFAYSSPINVRGCFQSARTQIFCGFLMWPAQITLPLLFLTELLDNRNNELHQSREAVVFKIWHLKQISFYLSGMFLLWPWQASNTFNCTGTSLHSTW